MDECLFLKCLGVTYEDLREGSIRNVCYTMIRSAWA